MEGWSIVQTFMFPQDAYMARAYLESAGLETIIQDDVMAQVYSLYSNAIGGVKLLVRNAELDTAIWVLTEGGYLIADPKGQAEHWVWAARTGDKRHCPFCHSENIAKVREVNVAAGIVHFMLGGLFPEFRPVWKCYNCGMAWKYKRDNMNKHEK